jgi:hypothetical protein
MPTRRLIALPPPVRAKARPIPLAQPKAAATPPGDTPGPAKPNAIQLEMRRSWLKKAQKLMDKGLYLAAIIQARMSYRLLKSTAAIRIIGHCACLVGHKNHIRYARWAYGLLSQRDRRALRTTCSLRRISLP